MPISNIQVGRGCCLLDPLLDQPPATIADIVEILLNKDFRKEALRYVKSESVKKFWKRQFLEYM